MFSLYEIKKRTNIELEEWVDIRKPILSCIDEFADNTPRRNLVCYDFFFESSGNVFNDIRMIDGRYMAWIRLEFDPDYDQTEKIIRKWEDCYYTLDELNEKYK